MLVVAGIVAAAAASALLAVVVNIATGGDAGYFPWVATHPLWWVLGSTLAVALSSVWVVWAQRRADRRLVALVPVAQRPEKWVVDRPAEVAAAVAALCGQGGTVGVTTALRGAGGFGKTTVAKLVRADPRVLRHFRNRVYWVTLGRDVRSRGALARKVNDLIGRLDPGRPVTFTDPEQAGEHLATLLAGMPRTLLILDDVWYPAQEAAFPVAGKGSARLITTRIPSLVERAVPVRVDEVTEVQAKAILTADLPTLSRATTSRLLAATGRWPLLLRLANKVLVDQCRIRADVRAVAAELLEHLDQGPLRVDRLTGVPLASLDVNDPRQRDQAVATTIEASAGLLTGADRQRLTELSLFVEDETVPILLVSRLWRSTGELDTMATRALCSRLHDLALITLTATRDGGTLTMHDAIRDYLYQQVPEQRRPGLHAALLDAVGVQDGAWWNLDESHRYLWDHLIEHLLAARRTDVAEAVAADLRWVAVRLEQAGPTAPYADLSLIDTPLCHRLRRLLGQSAHLLAPTDPPHSRVDVLHSRTAVERAWAAQAAELATRRGVPRLVNKTTLPDPPHPALLHVLPEKCLVVGILIAPDSAWFTNTNPTSTEMRVWDVKTGGLMAVLRHPAKISAARVSPDGAWIATAAPDGVRLWHPLTGELKTVMPNVYDDHPYLYVAPDSSWLAVVTDDEVQILDAETGGIRTVISYRHAPWAAVVSPDGTWLALGTASDVRVWDVTSGKVLAVLPGAIRPHVATADARRLFTSSDEGVMRLWNTASWTEQAGIPLEPHGNWPLVAANGEWVAVGDHEGVRVYNTTTGDIAARLPQSRYCWPLGMAPDGRWLAVIDGGNVRVWDIRTGAVQAQFVAEVVSAEVAPDGARIATHDGHEISVWDTATGHRLSVLPHFDDYGEFAIAPDGTWLATGGQTLRIWDTAVIERSATKPSASAQPVIGPDVAATATSALDATVLVVKAPGTTAIIDTATGRLHGVMHHGLVDYEHFVTPDGSRLVTASKSQFSLWNVKTGESIPIGLNAIGLPLVFAVDDEHEWVDIVAAVRTAAAPDGSWLAVAGTDGVRVYDTKTGDTVADLDHVGPSCSSLAAPDGTWLATSNVNGVRIWDTSSWELRSFTPVEGRVAAVAPDATWLATVGLSGGVGVWAVGGERVAWFDVPGVRSAVIAPDSSALLMVSEKGELRVWWRGDGATALMRTEQPLWGGAWSADGGNVVVVGPRGVASFMAYLGVAATVPVATPAQLCPTPSSGM
ncbi:hypothetical protein ADK67_32560 [Saccharothrix sp. NRRL B-16348]|uniref:NB-ARC domain-containing protein n=1 Tax=Saccharothrix sp. NRRL B-16348 TaxID=1415542 RepID=UPI0006AF54BA|nr:NB-ARC domain-containing protein [Saccharothrix sp. NRRL B-16348]KOX19808.1 hypothetical protein ADK67_32560 [Saccharothrix sp. NRRL B-16348]